MRSAGVINHANTLYRFTLKDGSIVEARGHPATIGFALRGNTVKWRPAQESVALILPVFVQQATHRIRHHQMRGIPGMQAANAGEIGNAAYALAGKNLFEIEFDQPLPNRVSHVTLAQFSMRLVINAHAALELGILVDLSLELFDQPHCFYLIDAVAQ